jgi:quinol monooxygenase YgiN
MPVTPTTAANPAVTTLINILTVEPERQKALLALLQENTDTVISGLDGWISTSLIASDDGKRVVIHSQWRDLASVDAMRANREMRSYFPRITALATFDSFAGEVAYARHA